MTFTVDNGPLGHFEPPPSKLFNIVTGPDKWDLLTAFGNNYLGQTVEFQYFEERMVSGPRVKSHIKATIHALEHEIGTGNSWSFRAHAEMPNGQHAHLKGYYNSCLLNGHFEIVA
jgi:hypothetical protein